MSETFESFTISNYFEKTGELYLIIYLLWLTTKQYNKLLFKLSKVFITNAIANTN